MIGATKFYNGSHDLTTPLSRTICHPKAGTCYDQHAHQM